MAFYGTFIPLVVKHNSTYGTFIPLINSMAFGITMMIF
jgi:hypothetical protein